MTHQRSKPRVPDWLALVLLERFSTVVLSASQLPACLGCNSNLLFLLLHPPAAGIESGKPTHFTVLTKGAGKAPLDVSFSAPVNDFDVIDNYDYSQTVKYTPSQQVSTALLLHSQLIFPILS